MILVSLRRSYTDCDFSDILQFKNNPDKQTSDSLHPLRVLVCLALFLHLANLVQRVRFAYRSGESLALFLQFLVDRFLIAQLFCLCFDLYLLLLYCVEKDDSDAVVFDAFDLAFVVVGNE